MSGFSAKKNCPKSNFESIFLSSDLSLIFMVALSKDFILKTPFFGRRWRVKKASRGKRLDGLWSMQRLANEVGLTPGIISCVHSNGVTLVSITVEVQLLMLKW